MVICFAIVGITIGGILTAYTNSSVFAERAGYALAAQAQSVQILERARAATWDTQTLPQVTDYTSQESARDKLGGQFWNCPYSFGTNVIYATNFSSSSRPSRTTPTRRVLLQDNLRHHDLALEQYRHEQHHTVRLSRP